MDRRPLVPPALSSLSAASLCVAVMAIERPRGHDGPRNASSDASSDEEIHSDTSSELIELQSDEFPRYFVERNGRLFHSHGRSPYPLPVDAAEQHVRHLLIEAYHDCNV